MNSLKNLASVLEQATIYTTTIAELAEMGLKTGAYGVADVVVGMIDQDSANVVQAIRRFTAVSERATAALKPLRAQIARQHAAISGLKPTISKDREP